MKVGSQIFKSPKLLTRHKVFNPQIPVRRILYGLVDLEVILG
jgi:hypothetical protein